LPGAIAKMKKAVTKNIRQLAGIIAARIEELDKYSSQQTAKLAMKRKYFFRIFCTSVSFFCRSNSVFSAID
jgi:hypothetical protein